MAIDDTGSFMSNHDKIQSEVHRNRQRLEEAGVAVIDAKIVEYPRYDTMDVTTMGNWMTQRIQSQVHDSNYGITWQLEMKDRHVSDLLELSDKCRFFQERLSASEHETVETKSELTKLRNKVAKLRKVLEDNPGVRDQWEEVMVLVKLAGFDESLV